MKKYFSLLVTLFFVVSTISAQQDSYRFVPANNPYIGYMGRINFKHSKSPCMVYPGSTIQVMFTGTSLRMKAKPKSGYFMVETDRKNAHKIFFSAKDSIITVAKGLKNGKHQSTVMLVYEGYNDRPEFRGFYIDKGASVLPLVQNKKLKLEFIGNSITCAYGVEAKDGKEHFSESTENFYYSYANIKHRNE